MQLWSDFGKTVVFVTHDVEEAIYLSDEIHVMGTRPGRIIETIPVTLPRPRVRTSVADAANSSRSRNAASICSCHRTASEPPTKPPDAWRIDDRSGHVHASAHRRSRPRRDRSGSSRNSQAAQRSRSGACRCRRTGRPGPSSPRSSASWSASSPLWEIAARTGLDRCVLLVAAVRDLARRSSSSSPTATPGPTSASRSAPRSSASCSAPPSARCSACRSGGRATTPPSCSPTSSASSRSPSSRSRR